MRWNMSKVVNNNWPTGINGNPHCQHSIYTTTGWLVPSSLRSIIRFVYGCDKDIQPVLGLQTQKPVPQYGTLP